MAENTTVGPAGTNHAPNAVSPHKTYGHLDDNPEGGFTGGSVGGSVAGPPATGKDFPTPQQGEDSIPAKTGSPVNAGGMV